MRHYAIGINQTLQQMRVSRQGLKVLIREVIESLIKSKDENRTFEPESLIYFTAGKTPWSESASELYRPSDRRFSAKCCQLVRIEGATWSA
jgi:hypothetical protein